MKAKDLAAEFEAGNMTLDQVFATLVADAKDLIAKRKCSNTPAINACWEEQMQKYASFRKQIPALSQNPDSALAFEAYLRENKHATSLFTQRDLAKQKAKTLVAHALGAIASIHDKLIEHLQCAHSANVGSLERLLPNPEHHMRVEHAAWLADNKLSMPAVSDVTVDIVIKHDLLPMVNEMLALPEIQDVRTYATVQVHIRVAQALGRACSVFQSQCPDSGFAVRNPVKNYLELCDVSAEVLKEIQSAFPGVA